jgi:Na+/proline symporter
VALILGLLWRRYTTAGALATLVGGTLVILLSMKFSWFIDPFSHGIDPSGEGALAYKYIRAFFGIVVCCGLGVIASALTKPKSAAELKNLVVGEIE